jgi:tRNA-dihydrouridine synthase B
VSIALAGLTLASPVVLAPMAGITDLPFRRLVARFGAGLVVSEMVASQEMVHGGVRAMARAALGLDETGTAVQLAGREPRWMAEAARMAEANGARIIDINMGCPAKRVTGGLSGSGLLREPDRALRLIEAVVGAVRVPVTLKTRLGWDDACTAVPDLLRRAEAAGVAMITLHGRSRCAFYSGRADWAAIAERTRGLGLPVLANGDIDGPEAARAALAASGAAGVMVGRAARGRPWLLAQIASALAGGPVPQAPRGAALADLVAGHYEDMLGFHGAELGLRVARKHLGWYLDAAEAPEALRRPILTADSPAEVLRLLTPAFAAAGDPPLRRRAA